jgi:6-pyruvoyl-tetrahydropterin synthase
MVCTRTTLRCSASAIIPIITVIIICLNVSVKGEIDPATGYVIDMKVLKDLIRRHVEEPFDHRNLNLDTEEFKNLNPTAETYSRGHLAKAKTTSEIGIGTKNHTT